MSIISQVRSIEFDRNRRHIFGIKSGILWGHSKVGNSSFPLLYISKPKHIKQDDFEALLNNLIIELKDDNR